MSAVIDPDSTPNEHPSTAFTPPNDLLTSRISRRDKGCLGRGGDGNKHAAKLARLMAAGPGAAVGLQ
jgi:hypothetical protein